jgi:hypothetical protein
MKEGSIQVSNFYLGVNLKKTVLQNGVIVWGMSSSKYVQSDVHTIFEYLTALPVSKKLIKKAPAPLSGGYKSELDESPALDPIMANFFQL